MVVGAAMVAVIALATYDQLLVNDGDDSSYVLGKATPAVAWVLTLATPVALVDFFVWLRRSQGGTPAFWWSTVGVIASVLVGWYAARGLSLDWLVEGDIEVGFDRDEFLEIVVGLWSACLAALVIWITLRARRANLSPAADEILAG